MGAMRLIVGGVDIPVSFPVITWKDPGGFSFYGEGGWSKRSDQTGKGVNLFMLHWTDGFSAARAFTTMKNRDVSVHLFIDNDGTVYQALDLAVAKAWHGNYHNNRSVGVEIVNPVKLDWRDRTDPPRPVVTEHRVHRTGTWQHLDFYNVQKSRAVELAEAVCKIFDIPRVLPMDGAQVSRAFMPSDFRGVCGHYHVIQTKKDPGLSLWPELQAAGFSGGKKKDRPRVAARFGRPGRRLGRDINHLLGV